MLAKAVSQPTSMLNVTAPSRASLAPTGICVTAQRSGSTETCGSEPAREGALSVDADAGLATHRGSATTASHPGSAVSKAVSRDLSHSRGLTPVLRRNVHALRYHITSSDAAQLNWLGGLRDPAIAKALRVIHHQPERPWKLAELADIACMSRSSFAAAFKARVGQAPVEYVTRWRMRVAASRLRMGTESVASVAASLGYLSDAAFGVAFRRVHGQSPGHYRRDRR